MGMISDIPCPTRNYTHKDFTPPAPSHAFHCDPTWHPMQPHPMQGPPDTGPGGGMGWGP